MYSSHKRPSYFDPKTGGIIFLPNWREFTDCPPTCEDLALWFSHPDTGLGMISGSGGYYALDIDAKHFESVKACHAAVSEWRFSHGWRSQGWVEITGGGGVREIFKTTPPTDYAISLSPNGDRHGEFMPLGTFAILAPSLHQSGNHYRIKLEGDPIACEWEAMGLYPAKTTTTTTKTTPPNQQQQQMGGDVDDYGILLSILSVVPPDCEFSDWFKLGAALKATDPIRGWADWEAWSAQGKKYHGEKNLRTRWAKMQYGHIGAAINIGKKYGWQPPYRSRAEWQASKAEQDRNYWESLIQYSPDITLRGQYVELPDHLRESGQDLAIKAGLGAGKTEELIKIYKAQNKGGHLINARNSLQIQTLNRFKQGGVKHAYHVRSDGAFNQIRDSGSLFASCPDTALRFDHDDFYDRGLYLDEINSTVGHTLMGGTLGSNQIKALLSLEAATTLSSKTIACDRHITDWQVRFLEELSGRKFTKIEHSKPTTTPRRIHFVKALEDGKNEPINCNSPIIKLATESGKKCLILTDSLRQSKATANFLLERGFSVLLVNSETVGLPEVQAFMADPNTCIMAQQYDRIIFTPTVESGLSIDVMGYFDYVLGMFYGVLSSDSLHQQLFRVRDNVPIYIAMPEVGLPTGNYYPKGYRPEAVRAGIDAKVETSFKEFARIMVDVRTRYETDPTTKNERAVLDCETVARALDLAGQIEDQSKDIFYRYFCLLIAKHNYERDHLKACLRHLLEQDGHEVIDTNLKQAKSLKDGLSQAATEVDRQDVYRTYNAREIDDTEADRLRRAESISIEDRHALNRYYLESKAPGLWSAEWWRSPLPEKEQTELGLETQGQKFILRELLKRGNYLRNSENYYLLHYPEIVDWQIERNWHNKAYNPTGREFRARLTNQRLNTVIGLERVGILRLIEISEGGNADHPVWQDIIKRGGETETAILLGIDPPPTNATKKDRSEYVLTLAKMAGLEMRRYQPRSENGTRLSLWKADPFPGWRVDILNRIAERISSKYQEATAIDWAIMDQAVGFDSGRIPTMPQEEIDLAADGPPNQDPIEQEAIDPIEQEGQELVQFNNQEFSRGDRVGLISIDYTTNTYDPESPPNWHEVNHWGDGFAITTAGERINIGDWVVK